MKKIIKLLLLAALAWPAWFGVAAQEMVATNLTQGLPVQTADWQQQFKRKSPDVAKVAQPAKHNAEAQTSKSTVDKKPQMGNGRARKAAVAAQNTGKKQAPSMAPRGVVKAPPAGATIEQWLIQTDWYDNGAYTSSTETGWVLASFGYTTVNVAITGGKVYIQGLSKYCRDGWVEGTISGTTVTFASGQSYGTDGQGREHYFVGEWQQKVAAVRFVYDSSNGILTQYSETGTNDDGSAYSYYTYINEGTTTTDLKGFGYHEGMVLTKIVDMPMVTLSADQIKALENSAEGDLFHYKYPINVENPPYTGTLLDNVVVTDELSAAHAIALLRAVYTNKNLPGPYYRGYTSAGVQEGSVSYAGVGTMSGTATNNGWPYYYQYELSKLSWNDTYGWNIPATKGKIGTYTSGNDSYQYAYFDPEEYKPLQEGYTLLLVEMKDGFKTSDIWDADNKAYRTFSNDAYENLVQYVMKTIKSVRLLTEAKRTGTNVNQGTLFKIDADKLNRFFLISKGQARYYKNSYVASSQSYDFCDEPYYGLASNSFKYNDGSVEPLFYHMFEQFSPAVATDGTAKSDIYKALVTGLDATGTDKTGFPVYHDCSTVPFAECDKVDATTGEGKGHEFKMLADDDPLTSAPDVRDLLFFVPDYRMTYHTNTVFPDGSTNSRDNALYNNDNVMAQQFIYYNQEHAPRMDMYVIHLNPITGEQVVNETTGMKEHVYELELNWKSNMSSFLPAEEQLFTLWRIVTDADGTSEYQPVYRTNHMGQYVDANGNVLADQNDVSLRVPVEMQGIYSLNELDYFDYVPMDATGKEVTYAVRGQDTGKFLSLQYSNAESYLIPGYDKNVRMTLKINSDNYSKFDIANEQNNYWNEIAVANNKGTSVTANFLKEGTVIDFSRRDPNIAGNDSVLVARATVTEKKNSTIKVSMQYFGQVDFGAGCKIKANEPSFTFTFPAGEPEGTVDFGDWKFYDNFQADVSKNEHPNRYVYRAFFHAAEKFLLDDNVTQSNLVYSNERTFKVFKTTPSVNGTITLQQVLDDDDMSVELTDNSKYYIEVERSPKSLIWRYEVCRWDELPEPQVPTEFDVFGKAQNQEDTYSLSFGKNNFEIIGEVGLQEGVNTKQVQFEDAELEANGGAYDYVPQVVVYTKRSDNNTYGAPRLNTAVGKLEVDIDDIDDENPLMSIYKWRNAEGNWYSYYKLNLKFKALNVPAGYEPYKVRAWRKVDGGTDVLGEILPTRSGRAVDGWYMFEDMNFGDALDASPTPNKMSLNKLESHRLGSRPTSIVKPVNPDGTGGGRLFAEEKEETAQGITQEEAIKNETRATFGALRLTTESLPTEFKTLKADFKVRVYFTKVTNPLILGESYTVDPIYVLGSNNNWNTNEPIATLTSTDGITYSGTVTFAGDGYFSLTNQLGSSWSDIWNQRLGVQWDNYDQGGNVDVTEGFEYTLMCAGDNTKAFKVSAGTYNLSLTNFVAGPYEYKQENLAKLVITRAAANAPRRAGETAMKGSDYDYYIAEGEAHFEITSNGTNIITAVDGVKANREVAGVNYVNTIGQVSNRPWQGVNVVVTRYTDGTTKTTKAVY